MTTLLGNEWGMEERPTSYSCLFPGIVGDEVYISLRWHMKEILVTSSLYIDL